MGVLDRSVLKFWGFKDFALIDEHLCLIRAATTTEGAGSKSVFCTCSIVTRTTYCCRLLLFCMIWGCVVKIMVPFFGRPPANNTASVFDQCTPKGRPRS